MADHATHSRRDIKMDLVEPTEEVACPDASESDIAAMYWRSANYSLLNKCVSVLPRGVGPVAKVLATDAKTPLIMALARSTSADCLTHVVDAYFSLIMIEVERVYGELEELYILVAEL